MEEVVSQLEAWLAESAETNQAGTTEEQDPIAAANRILARLQQGGDRLTATLDCFALQSPSIAQLRNEYKTSPIATGKLQWLDSADLSEFVRTNVRAYAGRALVRQARYDDALLLLANTNVEFCVDPASLLFYRAVAEHQLVQVAEAGESLQQLLGADEELPERFAKLAHIMQADVANVEDDSLDHIARRMADVQRRLGLGQADEKAQDVELGILASLDKVIEQAEAQQKKQQQKQKGSGSQPSGQPMEESQIAERKGPGKVDIKDIGDTDGWGELPPRERERVLQQIGRDFPGHYRDLMEEYLKRLATDQRDPDETQSGNQENQ